MKREKEIWTHRRVIRNGGDGRFFALMHTLSRLHTALWAYFCIFFLLRVLIKTLYSIWTTNRIFLMGFFLFFYLIQYGLFNLQDFKPHYTPF
ncbi:hypothetical protein HanIR_Chr13g0660951 [Helianthus annuus]|nr:hypothetical protein HanIR_Chr13g0660951 [Helianthus annuus]